MQPGLPFDAAPSPESRAPSPEYPPPVFVRHPRARRYVVSVREDGRVRVTLPRWGSMREAQAFAGRLDRWIAGQRQRLEADRAKRPPTAPDHSQHDTRARAKQELPPRLLKLAGELGLEVSKVSVRNQRWRWGSCSPKGHICLNWRLVAMPPRVRDYVMIHELMHLRRMDHSKKFWKLVAQACPDYEAARRWLRQHGRSL
jgi:predicted metal-dependent hydrolase